ncbi:MAG TPA: DAK2 domain-containing protein [Candidatus Dormibacteraeota bacterium]|jgi:DAK2 domain fusion protein YloV
MKTAPRADTASTAEPEVVDGQLFKRALLGSLSWLGAHQEEVNRLNVFPVPDGDTGTNMLLTLQSAVEDIRESEAKEISKIAALAAHGSLMGARGNSGVILSQIFRGFAKHVQGKSALTPAELADALEEAANAAYRAVIKPTEGTILTVAREAGKAAKAAAAEPDARVNSVIRAACKAAKAATDNTPTQLAILREAGVVDAGGFGLQVILEGFLKTVEEGNAEAPAAAAAARTRAAPAQVNLELPEEGWGYCTEFLIEGKGMNVDEIRDTIAGMGNSALVVGDEDLIRVHVHTNEPTSVLAYASGVGTLARTKVDDMSKQHRVILESEVPAPATSPTNGHQPEPAAAPTRPNGIGLVAVVAGRGLADIFRGLGVDAVIEGGQTMNPSTKDMLKAVEEVPYEEVILLPNNANVILAAQQVPELTRKKVHILRSRTVPQGIAGVVAFNPTRDGKANLEAMAGAKDQVQTIEVTHAVRDSKANGVSVKKGDVIALLNDKLKHSGHDYGTVVSLALKDIKPDDYELVTVYKGKGAEDKDLKLLTEAIGREFPGLEVEVQDGGQQLYPFILSVE